MSRLGRIVGRGCLAFIGFALTAHADDEVYQAPAAFVAESFAGDPPEPQMLWLTKPRQARVTEILGHPYPMLRVRYWADGDRTAWVLEEIGKVKPITAGIVVDGRKVQRLQVLIYRESHGWEVRHRFFTDQFLEASLTPKHALDREIDGIAGATLSVTALEKLVRLALYLDQESREARR